MDSKEILFQYSAGNTNLDESLAELHHLREQRESRIERLEAARANYVISFLKRIRQYEASEASIRDLCLNVRELAIVLGRIRLPSAIYTAISPQVNEYGLFCEGDNSISCPLVSPSWLAGEKYISEVYSLKIADEDHLPNSPGDGILSSHTIFETYKSYEQKIAVHTALNLPEGHTLLVSQPTGGGKSLITQLLAAVSEGLTLVIVPTVALALDQFEAAKKNLYSKEGIYCFRGEQKKEEKAYIVNEIKERRARLLFSSPEALIKNDSLNKVIKEAASGGYLKNVVLDEAHIIPDWGALFRPDFQLFSVALRLWRAASSNAIRTYLLSATLSDDVVETLFTLFGYQGGNVELRCDTLRREPRFCLHTVKTKGEQLEKCIEAIEKLPKPMVVYQLEPREARNLRNLLLSRGYKNIPVFTGDTEDDEREIILKSWKGGDYDVVIATSAFGIGVDKSDVRSIVHACLPENLSRFYQEVGRAGRDGLASLSLLLPYQGRTGEESDIKKALGLVKGRVLRTDTMASRWKSLMDGFFSMEGDVVVFDSSVTPNYMSEQEKRYSGKLNVTWNINLLLFLHRIGYIELRNVLYQSNANTYFIEAKLLKLEELNNADLLKRELEKLREEEYSKQMRGYQVMLDLVQGKKSNCWGRSFKELFPLAKEFCAGCPAHEAGSQSYDESFKIRKKPKLELKPQKPSLRLKRGMGSFQDLVITSQNYFDEKILQELAEKADLCEIGTMVVSEAYAHKIEFKGLVLSYDEFYFTASELPYLFHKGLLLCFDKDQNTNSALMKALGKIKDLGYARIWFCSEMMYVSHQGKYLADLLDANYIDYNKL